MKSTLEKRALELWGLPTASPAMLAEKLLASLEDEQPSNNIEDAWNREALRRYKAFKAEKIKPLSHAQVMGESSRLVDVKF